MHRHDSKAFKVEVRSCAARQGSIWTSETIFVTGHSDGRIVFWKLVPTNRARREGIIPRDVVQSDSVCPRVLAPMWTLAAGGEIKNYDAAQTDENYVRNTDGAQKWREMNKDFQNS